MTVVADCLVAAFAGVGKYGRVRSLAVQDVLVRVTIAYQHAHSLSIRVELKHMLFTL